MNIFRLLGYISSATILLPFTLAAVSFKRLDNKGEKLFAYQMALWLVVETIDSFWVYFKLGSTHFISNLAFLPEGILVSLAMLQWLQPSSMIKKAGNYLIVLYILLWAFFIYTDGISAINQKIVYVENTLLCFFSGYVLINLVGHAEDSLLRKFEFWACAGIFLFYIATIELETLLKFLQFNAVKPYMGLFALVNVVGNCLYSIAFLCKLKPKAMKWSM